MAINDEGSSTAGAGAGTTAAGLLEPGYGDVLWAPTPAVTDRARVTAYLRWLAAERGLDLDGYDALWRWSVRQPGDFWATVWDYFDVPDSTNRGLLEAESKGGYFNRHISRRFRDQRVWHFNAT